MKQVITSQRIPIKMWTDNADQISIDQAKNLANLPFAYRHIAIMPDTHAGYGMPIGAVLASEKAVVPNAVGVDIGCGMCAVKTSVTEDEIARSKLKYALDEIKKTIPVGFNSHDTPQGEKYIPSLINLSEQNLKHIEDRLDLASKQVGTLGGGNHFVEFQLGDDGRLWIMIHSGSRGIGHKSAMHFGKIAKKMGQIWNTQVPPSHDLDFLPIQSQEGRDYMEIQNWCVEYALMNRLLMMERAKESIVNQFKDVDFDPVINKPHNFAQWENHFGKNLIIHRKGSCRASDGEIGMIPGSMGTHSYVVKGRGNRDSFESCSHGAGRVLGRNQARKTLDLNHELKLLEGVIHAVESERDLDEAPGAYKDIDQVMENQKDLVDIVVKLKPLAVLKG